MNGHAGTLLRAARTAKGLRQHDVARSAGMSASTLSVIETGRALVRPLDAARLGPVLGLDPADLLRAPLPQAPQEVPPSRTSLPSRATSVRSFKQIPATCPCDWRMVFEARRPSGWELAGERAECAHHGRER